MSALLVPLLLLPSHFQTTEHLNRHHKFGADNTHRETQVTLTRMPNHQVTLVDQGTETLGILSSRTDQRYTETVTRWTYRWSGIWLTWQNTQYLFLGRHHSECTRTQVTNGGMGVQDNCKNAPTFALLKCTPHALKGIGDTWQCFPSHHPGTQGPWFFREGCIKAIGSRRSGGRLYQACTAIDVKTHR